MAPGEASKRHWLRHSLVGPDHGVRLLDELLSFDRAAFLRRDSESCLLLLSADDRAGSGTCATAGAIGGTFHDVRAGATCVQWSYGRRCRRIDRGSPVAGAE